MQMAGIFVTLQELIVVLNNVLKEITRYSFAGLPISMNLGDKTELNFVSSKLQANLGYNGLTQQHRQFSS
jgi:hypothetical protein